MSEQAIQNATRLFSRAQVVLLTTAVESARTALGLNAAQRSAIRTLAKSVQGSGEPPERLLIAFKSCINDAADSAGIGLGLDRAQLVAICVSAFIEELYRTDGFVDDAACRGKTNQRFSSARSPGFLDARS